MQATIEIDDQIIPEGHEAVAFRMPAPGESFIRDDGIVATLDCHFLLSGPRLIVRRKWQWPSWLTCRAIAKDCDGTWRGFRSVPEWDGDQWLFNDKHCSDRHWSNVLRNGFVDISQFPDCEPEDSLHINPNWKE